MIRILLFLCAQVRKSLKLAKQQLKHCLVSRDSQARGQDSDNDEDEAPVFIGDVNRVFQRHVPVPGAIMACLHASPSSCSVQGERRHLDDYLGAFAHVR